MNDLLALAIVRKMLLELGFTMRPDASVDHIGALEIWLHEPIEQLGGFSPLRVLGEPGGAVTLQAHLQKMIDAQPPAHS